MLGASLGLLLEVPVFLSAMLARAPLPVFLVSHTLRDGGITLGGVLGLSLVFGSEILVRRRWRELGLLLLWGQLSAVSGHPITLVPQLAWFLLPLLFWWFAAGQIEVERDAQGSER